MRTYFLALLGTALALPTLACSNENNDGATQGTSAMVTGLEDANTSGPNLKKQFILYANGNALKEVVLQDGKYFVIESNMVYTGTWAFDLPTNTLTLTPAANSAAPPETTFKVIREDCDPQGWFPALESPTTTAAGPDRLTPYGIDPEFVKKYCHIFTG